MMNFSKLLLKKLELERSNLIKMAEIKLEKIEKINSKILRKQFFDLLNYCLFLYLFLAF
jgi:hypothetical protein